MRAAAYISAAIIALGIYLFVAATLEFAPTWIGLGMLAIASMTGIGIVLSSPSSEA